MRRTATVAGLATATILLAAACGRGPDRGRQRLDAAAEAIRGLRSGRYAFVYEGTGSLAGEYRGHASFLKPAADRFYYKAEIAPSPTAAAPTVDAGSVPAAEPPRLLIASDGVHLAVRDEALGRFSYGTWAGGSGHLAAAAGYAVWPEWSEADPFAHERATAASYEGRQRVGGVECDVIRGVTAEGSEVWWFIGVDDDLPRARRLTRGGDAPGEARLEIHGLETNIAIAFEDLAMKSLPGDEIVDEDARQREAGEPRSDPHP